MEHRGQHIKAPVGLIAEVGIADVLMSFCDKHDYRAVEAGRTVTRQAILSLSLRSTAFELDRYTCLHNTQCPLIFT